MQENANNNEDEWEEWESKEEDQATTDLERKLSCETEASSNKYESANQQKANLDLEKEEVHLAAADEPIAKSEIEQKDDGDQEEQQDNDQAIDMQLKQQNGLELILKEHILLFGSPVGSAYFHSSVISRDIFLILCIILVIVTSFCLIDE